MGQPMQHVVWYLVHLVTPFSTTTFRSSSPCRRARVRQCSH